MSESKKEEEPTCAEVLGPEVFAALTACAGSLETPATSTRPCPVSWTRLSMELRRRVLLSVAHLVGAVTQDDVDAWSKTR